MHLAHLPEKHLGSEMSKLKYLQLLEKQREREARQQVQVRWPASFLPLSLHHVCSGAPWIRAYRLTSLDLGLDNPYEKGHTLCLHTNMHASSATTPLRLFSLSLMRPSPNALNARAKFVRSIRLLELSLRDLVFIKLTLQQSQHLLQRLKLPAAN